MVIKNHDREPTCVPCIRFCDNRTLLDHKLCGSATFGSASPLSTQASPGASRQLLEILRDLMRLLCSSRCFQVLFLLILLQRYTTNNDEHSSYSHNCPLIIQCLSVSTADLWYRQNFLAYISRCSYRTLSVVSQRLNYQLFRFYPTHFMHSFDLAKEIGYVIPTATFSILLLVSRRTSEFLGTSGCMDSEIITNGLIPMPTATRLTIPMAISTQQMTVNIFDKVDFNSILFMPFYQSSYSMLQFPTACTVILQISDADALSSNPSV